jgi:hypothetical protein
MMLKCSLYIPVYRTDLEEQIGGGGGGWGDQPFYFFMGGPIYFFFTGKFIYFQS